MTDRPILAARQQVVLGMLEQAAAGGRKCPTNDEFGDRLNSSGSYASAVMSELQQMGIIRLERFARGREVEIVATGAKTAPVGRKLHWRQSTDGPKRNYVRRVALPDDDDGRQFRGDLPIDRYVDRDPCWRCGARADVGCRHREPSGSAPVIHAEVADGRRTDRGQGFAFMTRKR
jgi:hypothetical protein